MFDIGFQQAVLKTDRETASQNYVQDLPQYNQCPIVLINETFFRDKGLIRCIQDQKGYRNLYCKNGNSTAMKISSVI